MSDNEEEQYESDGEQSIVSEEEEEEEEDETKKKEKTETNLGIEESVNWSQFPGNAEAISDDEDDYNEEDDVDDDDDVDDVDDDDDDEEDDDDDKSYNYIENKIDNEFKRDFIKKLHPEEITSSFAEIKALTQIKRGSIQESRISNVIQDENHKTYPFLTKYEKSRILGLRISQLNNGARPLVELQNKVIDNHIIAKQELIEKKIPFIIMRPLPNGKKEYWKLQDLAIIER